MEKMEKREKRENMENREKREKMEEYLRKRERKLKFRLNKQSSPKKPLGRCGLSLTHLINAKKKVINFQLHAILFTPPKKKGI
jgi:hypothetical protein